MTQQTSDTLAQASLETKACSVQLAAMRADYNRCSRGQGQLLEQFTPLLESAVKAHSGLDLPVESATLPESIAAFVIADYGCSTGLNSSEAVSYVIAKVRERYGFNRCPTVLVVLDDLPRNGWSELFGFVNGDERSFLKRHSGVFSLSSGKTFYEQLLPDNCLQFGISSVCLQWCSRLPVKMESHCISMFASAEERELFKQQAAIDWTNFLHARSRELVKGGVLAVNFASSNEKANGLYDEIYNAAKVLLKQRVISTDELYNFNYRMHFRSLEEVTDKEVYEKLGLQLLEAERFPSAQSVYFQDYLQHRDARRFARECTETMSAACESSFLDALSEEKTAAEKKQACSQLWKEYEDRLAENPAKVSNIWGAVGVLIRKK